MNFNRSVWEFYGFSSEKAFRDEIQNPLIMVLEHERDQIEAKIRGLHVGGGNHHVHKAEQEKRWYPNVDQCDHGTSGQCGRR